MPGKQKKRKSFFFNASPPPPPPRGRLSQDATPVDCFLQFGPIHAMEARFGFFVCQPSPPSLVHLRPPVLLPVDVELKKVIQRPGLAFRWRARVSDFTQGACHTARYASLLPRLTCNKSVVSKKTRKEMDNRAKKEKKTKKRKKKQKEQRKKKEKEKVKKKQK